jgi:hypothetical protein
MSRIGIHGRWKKTAKGWQYIYNHDDSKVINRCLEGSLQVASLNTTPVIWECVLAYVTSPTDLRNLAATCRSLHELAESELGWSYLIRTKFGYRLWLRYIRHIFHRQNNQQIDLQADIETMTEIEIFNECATIPRTFLLNRIEHHNLPVTRAIIRSYRYHLKTAVPTCPVYIYQSEYIFRHLVLFKTIHMERLSDEQRRTVPLTKLIYFYLADRRQHPVVDFSMICPRA